MTCRSIFTADLLTKTVDYSVNTHFSRVYKLGGEFEWVHGAGGTKPKVLGVFTYAWRLKNPQGGVEKSMLGETFLKLHYILS
jgi:hypothetical protein